MNQYKSIFNQYNIISFENFESNSNILSSNIACTVLKVQEKKTQKGSTYAIVKFSDLSSVFELFVFSDIFENSRDKIKEGKSIMLTLIKNYTDQNKSQKRINVKDIVSLTEVVNKTVKNITFKFNNTHDLDKIKKITNITGETDVKIILEIDNKIYTFQLKNKRKIDNKFLNEKNLLNNVIFN